jgi:hypothetical protein
VQAKIIKLVGLKNGGRLSPIKLVTFAGTQNGELRPLFLQKFMKNLLKMGKHLIVSCHFEIYLLDYLAYMGVHLH